MCQVCGGSVCAGTGGCTVVVQHAPEIIRVSYASAGSVFSAIQSYAVALFTASKDSLTELARYARLKR